MKRSRFFAALAVSAFALTTQSAFADDGVGIGVAGDRAVGDRAVGDRSDKLDHPVAPVEKAFEIGVGLGYGQSVGDVSSGGARLNDVTGPGGTVEVDLGYRLIPELTLGVFGTGSSFSRGERTADNVNIWGASAGIQAAYHFRPDASISPWVSLGTGWRGLWLNPSEGEATSLHGVDIARLHVGADYRVSPEVAITPVLGVDLSTFVTQKGPGQTSFTDVQNPQVNALFFAGLAGRFDIGGQRVVRASETQTGSL